MAEEHPDLVALLRGHLDNAAAGAAGDHLAGCAECGTALVEAVVGHAVLTRTAEALAEPAARPQPQDGPLPPLAPLPRRGGRVVLLALAGGGGRGRGAAGSGAPLAGRRAARPRGGGPLGDPRAARGAAAAAWSR